MANGNLGIVTLTLRKTFHDRKDAPSRLDSESDRILSCFQVKIQTPTETVHVPFVRAKKRFFGILPNLTNS